MFLVCIIFYQYIHYITFDIHLHTIYANQKLYLFSTQEKLQEKTDYYIIISYCKTVHVIYIYTTKIIKSCLLERKLQSVLLLLYGNRKNAIKSFIPGKVAILL